MQQFSQRKVAGGGILRRGLNEFITLEGVLNSFGKGENVDKAKGFGSR